MIWLAKLLLVGAAGLAVQDETTQKPILERSPAEWVAAAEGRWKDWDADIMPPDNVQPFLMSAIQAYRQGHMTGTLEALFGLLELEPDYPSALHQAGVVYFRLRRYGDAIVAFERYLHVAPHRVGDTRALAHCYYTLGRYEDAQGHYEKVLAINSDSVEARRGYALCFMRLGNSEARAEGTAPRVRARPRGTPTRRLGSPRCYSTRTAWKTRWKLESSRATWTPTSPARGFS